MDNLKFIDHLLAHMEGAALASEAMLNRNLAKHLSEWANPKWTFAIDRSTLISAAIDMGVLDCYSTCIDHIKSLFDNEKISSIGAPSTWIELAIDSKDKTYKLQAWTENSRILKTGSVNAILSQLVAGEPQGREQHILRHLQRRDIFTGRLGVFSGLFTPEEIENESTGDDMDRMSFGFFKQLSHKTGFAWTKLPISNEERKDFKWMPVVARTSKFMTTDCFAGVVNLGRLKQSSLAKTPKMTGIIEPDELQGGRHC